MNLSKIRKESRLQSRESTGDRGHGVLEFCSAWADEHKEADSTCDTQTTGEGDDSVHTNGVDLSPYIPRGVDEKGSPVASSENSCTSKNNDAEIPEVGLKW